MSGRLRYHREKNSIAPWIRIRTIKAAHRGTGDRGEHRRVAGVGNKVPQDLREKLASDCAKGVFA